jgi:MoaA/NifB/PqqE/SkfB family radical SAM enzyme
MTGWQRAPLDFVAKLAQPELARQVRDSLRDATRSVPIVVDLDPTSLCDLACPECISGEVLNMGQFGGDRLIALCGELAEAGVRAVIFIGGGEPLLHRTTPEAMRVLCDGGVAVALVTNGTQLRRLDPSLLARLAWIRVSMDAATHETYQWTRPARGRPKFASVVENIRYAKQAGTEQIGYSFLVLSRSSAGGTRSNAHEIPAAARLAQELGCVYLEIKAQLTLDHFIDPRPGHEIQELRTLVDQAEAEAPPGFSILRASSLNALLGGEIAGQPKTYHWCPSAQLRTLVTSSGMYPCAYHRGDSRLKMGDASSMSFAQAWAAADTRRVNPKTDCRFHCARHDLNLACFAAEGNVPASVAASDTRLDPFI